jgi:hypothetical protein
MLCRVHPLIGLPAAPVRIQVGVLALVVMVVGGCSGSSGSDQGEPAQQISTAPVPHLSQRDAPLQVSVSKVTGNLSKSARSRLKTSAGRPVRRWLDAGFVGGTYPRADISQT